MYEARHLHTYGILLMPSRTTPYQIQTVPRYPEALQIYRIPASSFWQVRYFVDGKYIRRSTGSENKAKAITFAKQLFDNVRLAGRLDQQKHPYTFAAAVRRILKHQATALYCEISDKIMRSVAAGGTQNQLS
jgi:hypothetical protein